jgi:hypothetical protein
LYISDSLQGIALGPLLNAENNNTVCQKLNYLYVTFLS